MDREYVYFCSPIRFIDGKSTENHKKGNRTEQNEIVHDPVQFIATKKKGIARSFHSVCALSQASTPLIAT